MIEKTNNPAAFRIILDNVNLVSGRWWYRSTFFGAGGGLIIVRYGVEHACVDGVGLCRLVQPRLAYQVGDNLRSFYPCDKSLAWFDSLYAALESVVELVYEYS